MGPAELEGGSLAQSSSAGLNCSIAGLPDVSICVCLCVCMSTELGIALHWTASEINVMQTY